MSRLEQFRDSATGWPAGSAMHVPFFAYGPQDSPSGMAGPCRAVQFSGQPAW